MLDSLIERRLYSLSESNHLRMEAMELFEQCLTKGDESPLAEFVERQLVHDPPRLQLLRDLADDLQQRLLSLREYHFDVRDRVVSTLKESYGVDIAPLAPPDMLAEYHRLTAEKILVFTRRKGATLSEQETILLRKMLDASLQMAEQLFNDIQLTARLHELVLDWLTGMHATIVRQNWTVYINTSPSNERPIYH